MPSSKPPLRDAEFVPLIALMISLVALSIDSMLPALPAIRADLGVRNENDTQMVLAVFLLGLAIGQTVYGPISDSTGRKPAICAGFVLFLLGCLLSVFAASFPVMLAGRLLQGIGAAAPRVVTIALVRDQYEDRAMARIMSFVMSVFILVPIVAPALGQGILLIFDWRAIFGVFFVLALVALFWFGLRQRETLAPERRVPFSLARVGRGVVETCVNRAALGYTVTAGLIFGAFWGYLVSAQQIFAQQYALGALFPLYFGVLAVAIGAASFLNGRLVMRYGMRQLSHLALVTISAVSVFFLLVAIATAGHPPLWALVAYFLVAFFCFGVIFGNINAMAMEPLGHIAGVAAAVVGSLTTLISLALGTVIGLSYNGTVLPVVGGFAVLGVAALPVSRWAARASPG